MPKVEVGSVWILPGFDLHGNPIPHSSTSKYLQGLWGKNYGNVQPAQLAEGYPPLARQGVTVVLVAGGWKIPRTLRKYSMDHPEVVILHFQYFLLASGPIRLWQEGKITKRGWLFCGKILKMGELEPKKTKPEKKRLVGPKSRQI